MCGLSSEIDEDLTNNRITVNDIQLDVRPGLVEVVLDADYVEASGFLDGVVNFNCSSGVVGGYCCADHVCNSKRAVWLSIFINLADLSGDAQEV